MNPPLTWVIVERGTSRRCKLRKTRIDTHETVYLRNQPKINLMANLPEVDRSCLAVYLLPRLHL
ncbi:hypothetical protein PL8927_480031 [Planktothrix serta PCC 8927]|uniref:Uncharacterized protein n=1 Tax=Planktothrix serta PCC 8927 TaxID=671068 RepID=A0A7Z9BN57_9CYAN|nr:hypothetical protein PL8927_480031 [Planktothrix serta PCC 8927]